MRNFLQLFAKFGGFLLFLFLEGICFYLVVQFNKKQNQIFLSSTNAFVGGTIERYDAVVDYINLKDNIEELQLENARLRNQIKNAKYLDVIYQDSIKKDTILQNFLYIPANVTSNSVLVSNNYFTLNRGKRHGIEKHMGVISAKGAAVGIVTNVSDQYAKVMSLLNRQSNLSASKKDGGYFGSLVWKGNDPRRMRLEAVPIHAKVTKGDTIQTSGYSHIFPKKLMIGTVSSVATQSGDNHYLIEVELFEDFGDLHNVYIVKNLMKKDIEKLEE